MTSVPDLPSRRLARAAAAGAWGLALLSLATAALQIAGRLPGGAGGGLAVWTVVVFLAAAGAQAALTAGARPASASPAWLRLLAGVAGWAAAAMLVGAGLAVLTRGGASGLAALRLAEFAPVAQGFWALAVCAAAWRSRAWPPWLRVTGAVWGAGAAVLPGAPVLNGPVLLVGLAWWTGLGAVLLRARTIHSGRSTSA